MSLPAEAQASTEVTHGNFIINESGHRIRLLTTADPEHVLHEKPEFGSILSPGDRQHTTMTYSPFYDHYASFLYDVLDAEGKSIGTFTAYVHTGPSRGDQGCKSTYGTCWTTNPNYSEGDIHFLDPTHTELTYGAQNKQAQAQVLKSLCNKGDWKCEFHVRTEEEKTSSGKAVGSVIAACGHPVSKSLSIKYTEGVTDSFNMEVNAGAKIFNIIDIGVKLQKNHSVTKSKEFSETETLDVPADHAGWLVGKASVYRDTGDFTAQIGNTTLHINDVYFDSPIPGKPGILVANYLPMTPEKKKELCADSFPKARH
jgi:hypothetical protein